MQNSLKKSWREMCAILALILSFGGSGNVASSAPSPVLRSNTASLAHLQEVAHGKEFSSGEITGCNSLWTLVPSPDVGSKDNALDSVTAISTNDVWAVGAYTNSLSEPYKTLTMHWDGATWSVIPSPNQEGGTVLQGVAAISTNDVWAVGTVIEHWDGSQWSIIPNPKPASGTLSGIDAISANDIWAAGFYRTTDGERTLTMHWDGSQWSVIPSPHPSEALESYLTGISAVSANDVWAVGRYVDDWGVLTLTLHWNGSQWSIVPSPVPTQANGLLWGVAAVSANDVWTVGNYSSYGNPERTLIQHWDGTRWSIVPSPNTGTGGDYLQGITVVAANDIWVVGKYHNYNVTTGPGEPLTLHWDGSRWTSIPAPNIEAGDHLLAGVVAISANDVWSVGTYTRGATSHTLVERYTNEFPFADINHSSPFYPYIQCLYCRGVMGGYNDSTFRPGNNVTRGQLAKIVANAAGYNEPVSGQIFEDVEPGSTFYEYIERMALRGIIGGYSCGGPGEPCGNGNRAYFHPNASATRGQISKIVANAAGINDPAGEQRFEDVLSGSAFYDYVQRLANRGVMGGYSCGGPGEPCGNGNRAYFRPGNNATRGQLAKIVSNTFFPTCSP